MELTWGSWSRGAVRVQPNLSETTYALDALDLASHKGETSRVLNWPAFVAKDSPLNTALSPLIIKWLFSYQQRHHG